ncbi:MAG: hypothetical protein IT445_00295 [Phycisphaeraceae bacterium]|nr:hypothetical protein [Phycisphaeraceae bacterium]
MTQQPDKPDESAMLLDQRLNALLSQIELAEPGTVPQPKAAGDDLDDLIDRQVDEAIDVAAHASDQVAAEQTEGDDLADQVDSMLAAAAAAQQGAAEEKDQPTASTAEQSAQNQAAAATEALSQAAAEVAAAQPEPAVQEDLAGSFESPEDVASHEFAAELSDAVKANDHAAAQDAADSEDAGMAELDRLLAESADDAVSGEFESPDEVIAPRTEAASSFVDSRSASDVAAVEGATSADVAAELDETDQQEQVPSAPPAARGKPTKSKAKAPSQKPGRWRQLERALRLACAVINAPLTRLDEEWRNTVGYVGLLVTFTAVAMILLSLWV